MNNVRDRIMNSLSTNGVAILPPMDVFDSVRLLKESGIESTCTMLDPWYNKGFGGEMPLPEYDSFITKM